MLVSWMGFQEGQDNTWEPLELVVEDMVEILEDYLHSLRYGNSRREVFDLYF